MRLAVALISCLIAFPVMAASALYIERAIDFRGPIEVSETDKNGIRIDRLRFHLPATVGGANSRVGGEVVVDISISNTREESSRVGLAVALFGEKGELLAAATGGSRIRGLKAGHARTYRLVFDDVNDRAYLAKRFRLTVESRR